MFNTCIYKYENISEWTLIFYYKKSVKYNVSLSYVNVLLHLKYYTTAGFFLSKNILTRMSTLDYIPLGFTVYDCVTAFCDKMQMDVLYFRYFDINVLTFCFYYKLF